MQGKMYKITFSITRVNTFNKKSLGEAKKRESSL